MGHPAITAGGVAVVTGAALGIGRALAKRFVAEGMKVALLDVDVEALHDARAEIGGDTDAILCDVAEVEALERDDLAKILGTRPADTLQGTRELDAVVREAGPEMDDALVRYFYRHARREEALMKGGMGRAENARAAAIS